eukprot:gene5700-11492_t
MEAKLSFNCHGKGRVRLVKVIRKANGYQDIMQLNVQVLLEGDTMDEAFETGDNAKVVPTDTCKNTVYCLGKTNNFNSIEEFGVIVCRHFLTEYPSLVNKITVDIVKDDWQRLVCPDSNGQPAEHKHAFKRIGPKKQFTKVIGEKKPSTSERYYIQSGFHGLDVLKTTQSGFTGFHTDKYTSLPEVTDRLLGTTVDATWHYNIRSLNFNTDFNKISEDVENVLVNTFAGPADTGIYSASVQKTMFEMGKAAINVHPSIQKISLYMPNIHNIPFPLEKYGLNNIDHTGNPDIFYPIDEPHGMIKAEVERTSLNSRL